MRTKSGLDYFTFGAAQQGRVGAGAGDNYRYGFNGMESDDDVKGDGLDYTTEYRQYDPRVGRWFSPDPIVKPWESPYGAYANNPIIYTDPSGLTPGPPNRAGTKNGEEAKDDEGNTYKWSEKGKIWNGTINGQSFTTSKANWTWNNSSGEWEGSMLNAEANSETQQDGSNNYNVKTVESNQQNTSENKMTFDITNQADKTNVVINPKVLPTNYKHTVNKHFFDPFSMASTSAEKNWYAGVSLKTELKVADKIEVRFNGNQNGVNGINAAVEKFEVKGTYNPNGQIGVSSSFSKFGWTTPLAGATFSSVSGQGIREVPITFGQTNSSGETIWEISYRPVEWTLTQRRYIIGPATITYETMSWDGVGGFGDTTRVNVGPGIGVGVNLGPISPRAGYYRPGVWHGVTR